MFSQRGAQSIGLAAGLGALRCLLKAAEANEAGGALFGWRVMAGEYG
jgi:hypothetical protein